MPGCPELVRSGRCERHRKTGDEPTQQTKGQRQKAKDFYSRKRWRQVRGTKLNDQPLCEQCLKEGRTTIATEVHHVEKRTDAPERAYDVGNLESLCRTCHARESQRERQDAGI